jgi:hypothetical protein
MVRFLTMLGPQYPYPITPNFILKPPFYLAVGDPEDAIGGKSRPA